MGWGNAPLGFTTKQIPVIPARWCLIKLLHTQAMHLFSPLPLLPIVGYNQRTPISYFCFTPANYQCPLTITTAIPAPMNFEEFQSIKDEPLKKCPKCGKKKLRRLIGGGAAIVFHGSGFYQTDYRSDSYRKAAKAESTPKSDAAAAPCKSCAAANDCKAKVDNA